MFGVSYHSKHGAIQETQTVFLDAGLNYSDFKSKPEIKILEMGFGTGLNALMTLLQNDSRSLEYHTLEAYPIEKDQWLSLNYPEIFELDDDDVARFYSMHKSSSGESVQINERFDFTKFITQLEDYQSSNQYDVIYYDAFAPTSQEELWTEHMMKKMYDLTSDGGILVTYCAKGSFKRALKAAGYRVENLPGPIGKREMTRAIKDA